MRLFPLLLLVSAVTLGDVRDCACDVASPESMAKRECSLCREAEKQPPDVLVFYLKDINPNKPTRWLALPRSHTHALADLTPEQRTAFWAGAIEKAKQLWGGQWGLAINSDARRSQCHMHVHIGKLSDDAEAPDFKLVDGPADIPIPPGGTGILVHPAGAELHIHLGDEAPEMLLMR